MTCSNCENRIDNALRSTSGISSVKVRYSNSNARVTFDSTIINLNEIEKVIKNLGYKIKKINSANENVTASNKTNLNQLIGIVIIIIAVLIILKHLGGFNFFNSFPQAKIGMNYGVLFLIGLLTSIHCVAMCGGINLSQCITHGSNNENGNNISRSSITPSIFYNLGRVISYTIVGGIVGAIGSVISFSGTAKGIVAIIAGIFMVIMGITMLNIFPQLRKLNLRMPRIFARKINDEKRNSKSPFYIGLLNGLMPCGPLQAMQLYALSTGSFAKGAFSMFLFSLGTVPLMFFLGTLSSLLTKKFTKKMMQVSSVLVIILGVLMFQNGASISGIVIPSFFNKSDNSIVATIDGDVQIIITKLSNNRYEPITVKVGVPVRWTIQATAGQINGCNKIIIPEYNIKKELVVGDNIIEFTPKQAGIVPYSCWMGMIRSQINIVDELMTEQIVTD